MAVMRARVRFAKLSPLAGFMAFLLACGDSDGELSNPAEVTAPLTQEIEIRRGASGVVVDATIDAGQPNGNFGAQHVLRVSARESALLRFDLSSIPAGAVIERAILDLAPNPGDRSCLDGLVVAIPLRVHRVTAPWDESAVSHASFDRQHERLPAAMMFADPRQGTRSANVTALVRDWTATPAQNHGLVLRSLSARRVLHASSESPQVDARPTLTVTYAFDPCASSPCHNGGACSSGPSGYTCACPDGYAGPDCEVDVDECAPAPCQNGGECVDQVNGFSCECLDGYGGLLCEEEPSGCGGEPCAVELTTHASYISVAATGEGDVLVAYRDNANDDDSTRAVFDAAGGVVMAPTVFGPGHNFSAATTLASGDVAAVYSDFEDNQAGKVVVFDPHGGIATGPTTFASFANELGVAGFDDGAMLVAWGPEPQFAVVSAAGAVGPVTSLAANAWVGLIDAIALDDGNVLVVWSESGFGPFEDSSLRLAVIDPTGAYAVAPKTFDSGGSGPDGGSFNLDLARFGSGDIGVVYSRDEKGYLTVVSAAGDVVEGPTMFLDSWPISLTATHAPGGHILVALRDGFANNLTTWRVLDASGALVVGPTPFVAEDGFAYNQAESTTLPDGTVVLAYAETLDGSPPERGLLLYLSPSLLTP